VTLLHYPDSSGWAYLEQVMWRGFMYWWITNWRDTDEVVWLEVER
jgi:hypothetical protein